MFWQVKNLFSTFYKNQLLNFGPQFQERSGNNVQLKVQKLKTVEQVHQEQIRLHHSPAMWPDLAIYWTLGNFLKPLKQLICPNLSHS